ncbi:MAG: alanine--tRNA ligase [Candidatus Omnitrophica bacterium]|nr:alanine--tRNA ligase [Candidatus Omnitrophota bacterium]
MKTNELRKKYLEFFENKAHVVFPSDTLVPDDASVLFTSAGMNQFKPYFLGEKKGIKRATSCQKCLRTGDLEEVGKTPYHHTFFEMLGNFSFGDYFKKEAIEFAWEFVLKILNINEKSLWVSVYKEDKEAFAFWEKDIGLSRAKIITLGEDKNFWPASAPTLGPNGPCGPCSEIFFDRGPDKGCGSKDCSPACDCGRFVEIWNLVFTQFNRIGENKLEPLPQKNIDTGMGLERIAAVLQGKYSNFEIDILAPAVVLAKELLALGSLETDRKSLVYAIVDHARAASFAIGDGVYPSNEERGYVVRKIIRQACWKANLLGKKTPFLHKFVPLYADIMKEPYPQIYQNKDVIAKSILDEEERFLFTLKEGKSQFKAIVQNLRLSGKNVIEAQDLFKLYDTYGFPLELSRELAKEENIGVDERGFSESLLTQKELSRKKSMFDTNIFKKEELSLSEITQFTGYESLQASSKVLRIFSSKGESNSLSSQEEGLIVLDKTPFYASSGGQLSDKGLIKGSSGEFLVEEVIKVNEAVIHRGKVITGRIIKEEVRASVDGERRRALMRAHSATHLLQSALRACLGPGVMQQGSLVDEDGLRFDFTHPKALTPAQVEKVEDMVNEQILENLNIEKSVLSLQEAKDKGALAFFKDKYKDLVRMVSIGSTSRELCGGTHLDNTSEIGSFVIISESSISSGTRRIEALVGASAYRYLKDMRKAIKEQATILKCSSDEVTASLRRLFENIKQEKEKTLTLSKQMIALEAREIITHMQEIKGINFLTYAFNDKDESVLLYLSDILKNQNDALFVFFISRINQKDAFVCSASDSVIQKGFSCDKFASLFRNELSLKGGGRKNLVQGVVMMRGDNYLEKVRECFLKFTGEQ